MSGHGMCKSKLKKIKSSKSCAEIAHARRSRVHMGGLYLHCKSKQSAYGGFIVALQAASAWARHAHEQYACM